MNLKTLSLLSSVALATFAIPPAQAAGRPTGGGARISAPQMGVRTAPATSTRQQYTGTTAHSYNRTGYGGYHHPRYRPRYGGFYYGGYPYYNYPFGYGYGYGYPYFGASADLYYNGTHRYGRADYGYDNAGGDENVAVAVQRRLSEAGYYRGTIDGVIGNGTRNAIRAYERANRLPVDGRIDAELLSRMGIS